jgi:hypothetical protein
MQARALKNKGVAKYLGRAQPMSDDEDDYDDLDGTFSLPSCFLLFLDLY